MRRFILVLALLLCALPALPSEARLVAIGDLHGDLDATRRALRLAGAIDQQDCWIGGDLVVVQTGDQLDRGDEEEAILLLLDRLQGEAASAGGAIHILQGNHELMNARPDLRYVTEGGFADFADQARGAVLDSLLLAYPEEQRGRVAAFRPGGKYCALIADQPVILQLDDTIFVHGGVLPLHLEYGIDRINREVSEWLHGRGEPPEFIHTKLSPTWTRVYSDEVTEEACTQAAQVLEELGARRMVMGHTIQDGGITAHCGGLIWCVDTGMSAHYGGTVQVLEIDGDEIRVLREE